MHDSKTAWANLGWQFAGAVTIMVWSGGLTAIIFTTMRVLEFDRYYDEILDVGVDVSVHGESAYYFGDLRAVKSTQRAEERAKQKKKKNKNTDGESPDTEFSTSSNTESDAQDSDRNLSKAGNPRTLQSQNIVRRSVSNPDAVAVAPTPAPQRTWRKRHRRDLNDEHAGDNETAV